MRDAPPCSPLACCPLSRRPSGLPTTRPSPCSGCTSSKATTTHPSSIRTRLVVPAWRGAARRRGERSGAARPDDHAPGCCVADRRARVALPPLSDPRQDRVGCHHCRVVGGGAVAHRQPRRCAGERGATARSARSPGAAGGGRPLRRLGRWGDLVPVRLRRRGYRTGRRRDRVGPYHRDRSARADTSRARRRKCRRRCAPRG